MIVRPERANPGAQLSLFEEADGRRYTAFATNTRPGRGNGWRPATGRTPGSTNGSAAPRTPAWAGYRLAGMILDCDLDEIARGLHEVRRD